MAARWILRDATRDTWLLLSTRFIRLFAYGALSVVLVFYLIAIGLTEAQTGLLLTLTLLGDTIVSLVITTRADRVGRRRMLIGGALLMTAAGLVFASVSDFRLLLLAATIGVISPSGQEVGPFLPIEQAALARSVPDRSRTEVYAWYTLTGALATALGALAAGFMTAAFEQTATAEESVYRSVVILYAALGVVLAVAFSRLSAESELATAVRERAGRGGTFRHFSGVEQSGPIVAKLSALFALDAFGGGFVAQSFAAYWFHLRFGIDPATLGPIFFVANVLAGLSALLASRMASRFGLIRTMVWTHLPSNVLLIIVPLMPTLPLAVFVLLVRFSISQMDVPTRQSYVMAVVPPGERAAAGGVTGVARTLGAAVSPFFVGLMFAHPSTVSLPFFIAGTLKITYDLLLYRGFVRMQPLEEIK
ncbi:MAG TPA: MFS transporter [Vicinamibacterales bacterium]|nr:MFS transporter [Vicinamibacterales bacterium]